MTTFKLPKFVPPSEILQARSGQSFWVVDGCVDLLTPLRQFDTYVSICQFRPRGKRCHSGDHTSYKFVHRPDLSETTRRRQKYPFLETSYEFRRSETRRSGELFSVDHSRYVTDVCRRPYRFLFRSFKDAQRFVELVKSGFYTKDMF